MPHSLVLGNVGEKSFIGACSSVHQKVSRNNAYIGMNTSIVQNIKDNTKAVSLNKIIRNQNE